MSITPITPTKGPLSGITFEHHGSKPLSRWLTYNCYWYDSRGKKITVGTVKAIRDSNDYKSYQDDFQKMRFDAIKEERMERREEDMRLVASHIQPLLARIEVLETANALLLKLASV